MQHLERRQDDQDSAAGRARRKLEFAQGRACLHQMLRELGEHETVGVADDRSPIWPNGFVGSLSHTRDWIWGCVARQDTVGSIGIDTEIIANAALRAETQSTIATEEEWDLVDQFGMTPEEAFTLVFSAKEAFYKCWFPLVKTYFDFFDAEVVSITQTTICLKTLPTHPAFGRGPGTLKIEYLLHENSVFTVAWMEH